MTGRGRPKVENKKEVVFMTLDKDLKAWAVEQAEKDGRTLSNYLAWVLIKLRGER